MAKSDIVNLAQMSDMVEESAGAEKVKREMTEREKARLILLSVSNQGKWHLLQEFMLELHADGKLKQGLGQRFPSQSELLEVLKKKIEVEFKDDPITMAALILCVPTQQALSKWTKMPGWSDAVTDRMKRNGLYTPENRAEVIEALRSKAVKDGDTQAAKIWLTMSGDYTDKVDVTDTKFEKYKEYANALNMKKVPTNEE